MIRENVVGDMPLIDSTSFVDPSAIIIGRVEIGHNCYIGPSVVIRADRFSNNDKTAKIIIGDNCGIQDLAVLHVHADQSLVFGNETIVNHGAVIHGTSILGRKCFIGCKSVITNSQIGDGVFVRSNSIVENVSIPSNSFIDINYIIQTQEAVDRLRQVNEREQDYIQQVINENREYPMRYKYSLDT